MKVKELIVLLQRKNPEATVILMSSGDDLYADIHPELAELPIDGSVILQPKLK